MTSTPARLVGRRGLVTGGASGIGGSTVQRLAADGAAVVINFVGDREPADELIRQVREADGTAAPTMGSPAGKARSLFWTVSALAVCGRVGEARRIFENVLGFAGPLGLYSEEIDPASGGALGNYPQAFTHIGLIGAALDLQRGGMAHRPQTIADASKATTNDPEPFRHEEE